MKIITKPILLILYAAICCSCNKSKQEENKQTMTIQVTQVSLNTDNKAKEFSFISKPFRSSELSFRVGGPIDRFEVYAGNYYKRGNIIAEIDPRDFHIRRERTEAVYQQAKAEFERIKALYEKKNISASTYEKARTDYVSAKTAYETAVNELNDTQLIAPFDGYVGEVYIEKYQDVKATQPVISFIDIDQLKIETYVTQDIALSAQKLQTVSLKFDAQPEKVYEAKITEVSKSTTPNNLSYLLTALLPNPGGHLLAGMSGKLLLNTSAIPSVSIPQNAICHRPIQGDFVWVIHKGGNQVSKRPVILGGLQPNGQAVVLQGLQPGETIAVSGLRFLSEGMKIQPILVSQK